MMSQNQWPRLALGLAAVSLEAVQNGQVWECDRAAAGTLAPSDHPTTEDVERSLLATARDRTMKARFRVLLGLVNP